MRPRRGNQLLRGFAECLRQLLLLRQRRFAMPLPLAFERTGQRLQGCARLLLARRFAGCPVVLPARLGGMQFAEQRRAALAKAGGQGFLSPVEGLRQALAACSCLPSAAFQVALT